MNFSSIIKLSASTASLKLVQAILGIISAIFLSRLLGPEGYGVYAFGLAAATILAIPIKNGLSELVMRELSRAAKDKNWPHAAGIYLWSFRLSYGYLFFVSICIGFLFISLPKEPLLVATGLAIFILPGFALLGLTAGGVRAFDRPLEAILPDTLLRSVLHLSLIAVCASLFPSSYFSPNIALLLQAVAAGICFIGLQMFFIRHRPTNFFGEKPNRISGKSWIISALTFAGVGGLMIANRQIDLLILGVISSEKNVGLYRVAIQGGMLITFGGQAVNLIISPIFAKQYKGARGKRLSAHWLMMRSSILISCGVAFPGFILMLIFGRELLSILFGPDYTFAYPALIILSAANACAMLNGAIIPLLNMSGQERSTLQAFAAAALTNAVGAVIFVPHLGITGAATAAFLSVIVWSLILRRVSIATIGIDPIKTVFRKMPDV